jgi:hypothetical protein
MPVLSIAQTAGISSAIDNANKNELQSLESVIEFIGKHSNSEYERALGSYYWIARHVRYDIRKYIKDKPSYIKPADVFNKKKAVCIGYARLYQYMCRKLNLNCQIVRGYSKGYGYKSGQAFTSPEHAWNAVKIDSMWYLVDVTWASGSIHEKFLNTKFTFGYTMDYFAMNPHVFVLKHLPEAPMWQFLTNPVPLKIFSSDSKKIETSLKTYPPRLFYYQDTIKSFLLMDSIQQLLKEGEMALAFNPVNTSPLAIAILYSISYRIKNDSLFFEKVSLATIDSMIGMTSASLDLFKKCKGPRDSFKRNIEIASLKSHEVLGVLNLFKSDIIKRKTNFTFSKTFDSLFMYSKPFLISLENSVIEYRKTDNYRVQRLMERNLCENYIRFYNLYFSFLDKEDDLNKKKVIQKEISALVRSAQKNTLPYRYSYKAINKAFIRH